MCISKPGKRRKDEVSFRASVGTMDISAGGMFVKSTFFLKSGEAIDVGLELPELGKTVQVSGVVLRVASDERRGPTGFAVRFDRFHGDSEIYLRAFLAKGDMFSFVRENAPELFPGASERQFLRFVELLVRWELFREASDQLKP